MSDEPSKCAACLDKEDHTDMEPEACSMCGIEFKGNCATDNLEFPLDDNGDEQDPICHKCVDKKCFKCGGKPAWDDGRPLHHIDDPSKVWCQACFDAADFCVGPSVVKGKTCGEPAVLKCLNCKEFVCESCADSHRIKRYWVHNGDEHENIFFNKNEAAEEFKKLAILGFKNIVMDERWSHCGCLVHEGCDCESCFNTCIMCEKCEKLLGDDADFKGEICDDCGSHFCTSCIIVTEEKYNQQ